MTRQEANMEILRRLGKKIIECPDLRFSQILFNLNLVEPSPDDGHYWADDFYIEPQEMLKRMPEGE